MQDIKKREQKMQQHRKNTPRRSFVKDIVSWYPIVLYRNKGQLSRYPDTIRISNLINKNSTTKYDDIEYNDDISFFDNFTLFFKNIEKEPLIHFAQVENSNFSDIVSSSKNAYLSRNITNGNENILYSLGVKDGCKEIQNSIMVRTKSNIVYSSVGVINSFKVFYSRYISDSSDIRFSSNLIGCHNCILCNNLNNQSYCINNKQYSKDNYEVEKNKILDNKNMFTTRTHNVINTEGTNFGSKSVSGKFILNSTNVSNGYLVSNVSNSHNIILGGYDYLEDELFDVMFSGVRSNCYGALCCGSKSEQLYNCFGIQRSFNMYYCYKCSECSYCLGCIGLQNKQFYIFNKQYTKEDRFRKADEIFAQMDQDGSLGKFFPGSMNPFYFNDTAAHLIDDTFTKEEVESEGYLRRDEEIKVDIPDGLDTVKTSELDQYQGLDSEGNRKINPEILKKVIIDDQGNSYRIIKMEYDFLIKHGLPLPEIHRLDRIKMGFKFEHNKN